MLLVKYARDMDAQLDYDEKKTPYYSPLDNKIYLNIDVTDERDKALGFTKHTRCFLHEAGHWLDYNALGNGKTIHSELKDLRKFIESDILKKCGDITGNVYKSATELPEYGGAVDVINSSFCVDEHLKNGIMDICCGLTKFKIKGRYRHPNISYWKGEALEKEAIAHMFEAFASGGKKVKYMKEYLHTAFQYFLDFINKL